MPEVTTPPPFRLIGASRTPFKDFYHAFLKLSWGLALAEIVVAYLALATLFAVGYWMSDGIAHARPGSFVDAFNFSIQTMGTIGYGEMYPAGPWANLFVVAQSVTSLIFTAVATGLLFAKFSRSTARIVFTSKGVISPMDGVPTLMFRLGNQRGNRILDAQIHINMYRTERTAEGVMFYRTYELAQARDRAPLLSRSWTILHAITPSRPLAGATPESLVKDEVEILITVMGLDDTSLQPVHADKTFYDKDILWGARHADILSDENGTVTLDLTKFDLTVPTQPTANFPYPAPLGAEREAEGGTEKRLFVVGSD